MSKLPSLIYNHTTTWHDGNVSMLLSDGKIISLAAERVDRIKHSGNSKVVYNYLKERFPKEGFGTETDYFRDISSGADETGHHLYHASSAFFSSPFEKSAVLVIDGQGPERGKLASTTIWLGEEDRIELVESHFLTRNKFAANSIGHFYTAIGAMAGMQQLYEEGKTMALAAYGRPSHIMDFIRKYVFVNSDGTYFIDSNFIYAIMGHTFGPRYYGWKRQTKKAREIWKEFTNVRGLRLRKPFEEVSQEDMDTAYAGQIVLEEIVLGLAKRSKKITGATKLCLSGGVALNGLVNTKIANSGLFEEVYVFPASGDDGQSIGKLFYEIHKRNLAVETRTQTAFYGPQYTKSEIETALKKSKGRIQIIGKGDKFAVEEAAERLANGEVIARFVGGSEIGPRALGHRSILADPRSPSMRDYLNNSIKNREWYRPFAPLVIEEEAGNFFDLQFHSPFMLFMGKTLPQKKGEIPSAIHIDDSARVQTINPLHDSKLYALVKRFGEITGVPVLINTSFNRRNEPIVENPEDALDAFFSMNLDYLVLEDFLITKRR